MELADLRMMITNDTADTDFAPSGLCPIVAGDGILAYGIDVVAIPLHGTSARSFGLAAAAFMAVPARKRE